MSYWHPLEERVEQTNDVVYIIWLWMVVKMRSLAASLVHGFPLMTICWVSSK